MFLERVFYGKNDVGRWIAMIVIIVVSLQFIGLIPLNFKIFLNTNDNPDLMPDPDNTLDLTAYDISPVTGLAFLIIPFILGLIALFFLIKPIHERHVLSLLTGGTSFRWKKFLWGSAIWLILISVYYLIISVIGLQTVELQFDQKAFLSLALVSVLLLPIQAGFQETFFRGYLMQGFTKLFRNRWLPIIATSLLFGGLQTVNPEIKAFGLPVMMPQYIWFGILFGICTVLDDGIELAWGVHTINIIFLSVFFTRESNVIQTPALFNITWFNPVIDFTGLAIVSLLFIYIANRRFEWPGWQYLVSRVESPEVEEEEEGYGGYTDYDEYEDEDD